MFYCARHTVDASPAPPLPRFRDSSARAGGATEASPAPLTRRARNLEGPRILIHQPGLENTAPIVCLITRAFAHVNGEVLLRR